MAILIVIAGVLFTLWIVFKARAQSWTIDQFFLAGRNLGAEPTAQVFWGTSFSFANGLYYFATLGFFLGYQ